MARRARRGVSLLEVTFSIGIVMIGLLGVASLLPVAGALANKGITADAAARCGSDAVRDFQVRSMGDWRTWRWFDPALSAFRPVWPAELTAGYSFCLDPRFVAFGDVNGDNAGRNRFPYAAAAALSMPRITLVPSMVLSPVAPIMNQLQADAVFTRDDDLVFDLPDDRTLGPVQNFSRGPVTPFPPLRRNSNGHISWLATLVPKLDRLGNLTDTYTLSIVVCSRRALDRTAVDSERVAVATQFYSGQPALAGGDSRLDSANREVLELRSGDWVMLSGAQDRLSPLPPIQVHAWYRVLNAGADPIYDAGTGTWFRDVTLAGPDWNWGILSTPTQVTIVRGAVAVFEKTIRLETSSLWTP